MPVTLVLIVRVPRLVPMVLVIVALVLAVHVSVVLVPVTFVLVVCHSATSSSDLSSYTCQPPYATAVSIHSFRHI